jgi:flagellar M-ring protein FliF
MNEVTSARESYDKDGAVQRETTQTSQTTTSPAAGVPGVLSNTPPPTAQARPGAPAGGPAQARPQGNGESSASRTYAVGREVAVSNIAPGSVKRLSVAVALNQTALKSAKPADIKKFEQLITAAVGADPQRGDTVAVVVRPFQATEMAGPGFWETGWFATLVRSAVALIGVLLVLLLAVRPVVKALTGRKDEEAEDSDEPLPFSPRSRARALQSPDQPDRESLSAQIELAQRIVREQPDDALQALRRMLSEPAQIEGKVR